MKLNKKQKRTATIASMAALLAVVLGMGGQTFAKYITTTQTGSQSATVAKWGVVISTTATGTDSKTMFAKNYEDGDVSATLEKVAPGTEGSLSITVSGSPEVKTAISFEVNDDYKHVYFDTYEPIVWKIDDVLCGTNGTMAEMVTAFEELSDTYAVGTPFTHTYKISWSWAYHSSDDNDILDTKLADAATLSDSEWTTKYGGAKPVFSAEVSAVFTVTATQVGD